MPLFAERAFQTVGTGFVFRISQIIAVFLGNAHFRSGRPRIERNRQQNRTHQKHSSHRFSPFLKLYYRTNDVVAKVGVLTVPVDASRTRDIKRTEDPRVVAVILGRRPDTFITVCKLWTAKLGYGVINSVQVSI